MITILLQRIYNHAYLSFRNLVELMSAQMTKGRRIDNVETSHDSLVPCKFARRKFPVARRERHAREPILICATHSSDINPFYTRGSISISPGSLATRKKYLPLSAVRRKQIAQRERREEEDRGAIRNARAGVRKRERIRKRERGRQNAAREKESTLSSLCSSTSGNENYEYFGAKMDDRERRQRRRKRGEEAKAIRIFRNYRAGLN